MRLALGPVLYLGKPTATHWNLGVGMLIDGSTAASGPGVVVSSNDAGVTVGAPVVAADFTHPGRGTWWRWPVSVTRAATERGVSYTVSPAPNTTVTRLPGALVIDDVAVPARGRLPRIAFFSCNGVSEERYLHRVDDLNALWKQIRLAHETGLHSPTSERPTGHHVLLGGGDQLYADSLWSTVPRLRQLSNLSFEDRAAASAPDAFVRRMLGAYVDLYAERWSQPEVAHVLARIPGLFTWDDHDIFDGWGSYPRWLLRCPVYKAIFRAARKTFRAFQLGTDAGPHVIGGGPHHMQSVTFPEGLEILLPDLRSDRELERVLSDEQWSDLVAHLAAAGSQPGRDSHLLFVSSIPVVHMRFGFAEWAVGLWPGATDLDDDLRDQWESPAHRGERDRLAMNLLSHQRAARRRVTILSGDVHIGARGEIESRAPQHATDGSGHAFVTQLTSSGIVHPPPSALEWQALTTAAAEGDSDITPQVRTRIGRVSGELRYLRMRNWLDLGFDTPATGSTSGTGAPPPPRLWARWNTETGPVQPQVVVPGV